MISVVVVVMVVRMISAVTILVVLEVVLVVVRLVGIEVSALVRAGAVIEMFDEVLTGDM